MENTFNLYAGQSAASVFRAQWNSMHSRRCWFADESGEKDATDQQGTEAKDGGSSAETENTGDRSPMIPRDRFDEINAAKKIAEDKAQALQAELDKQKAELAKHHTAQEKAEQERLAKQGEFEQLFKTEQAKATDLTTQLEAKSARLEKLEGMFSSMLEKRKEGLPDHIKPLIDSMDSLDALAYLDEHADKLLGENGGARKQAAPPMNATDGTNQKGERVVALRKRVKL